MDDQVMVCNRCGCNFSSAPTFADYEHFRADMPGRRVPCLTPEQEAALDVFIAPMAEELNRRLFVKLEEMSRMEFPTGKRLIALGLEFVETENAPQNVVLIHPHQVARLLAYQQHNGVLDITWKAKDSNPAVEAAQRDATFAREMEAQSAVRSDYTAPVPACSVVEE